MTKAEVTLWAMEKSKQIKTKGATILSKKSRIGSKKHANRNTDNLNKGNWKLDILNGRKQHS